MNKSEGTRSREAFKKYVDELSATWYDGDSAKAFRHAAFQQMVDPSLADNQVIELTAIDKQGDLEVDGWFIDDTAESVILFQAGGGDNKVDEAKVAKFWVAPDEILNPGRIAATPNQSVRELARILINGLMTEDYNLRMIFAAKSGFVPSALNFASSRKGVDRVFRFPEGVNVTRRCGLELVTEADLAKKLDDYRAGLAGKPINVQFKTQESWIYPIEREGSRSLHLTVPASEIVRVFETPGVGFRLFSLNPRGPIANARVNKNIAKTLDSPEGRRTFHLLNNGLCAICKDFKRLGEGKVLFEDFQVVNGCQTTVTLKEKKSELSETLVTLKVAVADKALAESIATASNSQTALRAKDYAAFERQQKQLQFEFERLQPPWYYEIKQGYWRSVLTDREKARFKTGLRKRHIEVQPLAQASLAFGGYPAEALDRVRFVFQGIRSQEDREWYDRAFPPDVSVNQLLLPWMMLDLLARQDDRQRFSTFHLLWLVARKIREHYQVSPVDLLSPETSYKLANSVPQWLPQLYRVANNAAGIAYQRAINILGGQVDQVELRDFFRASREFKPGVIPLELLLKAFEDELKIEIQTHGDPFGTLPN